MKGNPRNRRREIVASGIPIRTGASGCARTAPGARRLVRGTAAGASQTRVGHCCATFAHVRSRGDGLACGPRLAGIGPVRKESRPEAVKPATAVPGGPGREAGA
jgi:hypothetical protein